MNLLHRLWDRVHKPRPISVLYFLIYLITLGGGVAALVKPPTSIEGQVGTTSMIVLAGILAFGGLIGSIAALPGIWWLERTAVLSIALSATIYAVILGTLHFHESGNRLLQLTFVVSVLLMQGVRWHRISERPYDPSRMPTMTA